jgi:hypothetical protein
MRDDKLWARGSHAPGWDGMFGGRSGRGHRLRTGQEKVGDGGCLQGREYRGRLGLDGRRSGVARCVQGGLWMGDGRCWWLKRLGWCAAVGVGFAVVKRFEVGLTLYSIQPAVFVFCGERVVCSASSCRL